MFAQPFSERNIHFGKQVVECDAGVAQGLTLPINGVDRRARQLSQFFSRHHQWFATDADDLQRCLQCFLVLFGIYCGRKCH